VDAVFLERSEMARLQITKLASGVRITDLETGAYEDVPVAAERADESASSSWLEETPVIVSDEPTLSGRLHYRA
jgi:hypothetical protein